MQNKLEHFSAPNSGDLQAKFYPETYILSIWKPLASLSYYLDIGLQWGSRDAPGLY